VKVITCAETVELVYVYIFIRSNVYTFTHNNTEPVYLNL